MVFKGTQRLAQAYLALGAKQPLSGMSKLLAALQ
jgi:hypothetical protein